MGIFGPSQEECESLGQRMQEAERRDRSEDWIRYVAKDLACIVQGRLTTAMNEQEARHCIRLARWMAEELAEPTPVPKEWTDPEKEEEVE